MNPAVLVVQKNKRRDSGRRLPRGLFLALLIVTSSMVAPFGTGPGAFGAGPPAIDVSGVTLEFLFGTTPLPDVRNNIGANAVLNDVITYPSVAVVDGVTIGADVTVAALSGMIGEDGAGSSITGSGVGEPARLACDALDWKVRNVDRKDSSSPAEDRPLRHAINVCNNLDGFVEFTVRFFVMDGVDKVNQPLRNLRVSFLELNRKQYAWAYNVTSSRIPSGSAITSTVETLGADTITKLQSPDTDNANPIDSAEVFWAEVHTIRYRVGMDRVGKSRGTGIIVVSFAKGDFFPPEPTVPSTNPNSSARAFTAEPAIALTPGFKVGAVACGASVIVNGEGLSSGSLGSLTLSPSGDVLYQTTIQSTSFEQVVAMPTRIPPGSYTLTLSATGRNGEALQLSRAFSVDGACVVTSLGSGTGSSGLAQTGPVGAGVLYGALALLGLGLAIMHVRTRVSRA